MERNDEMARPRAALIAAALDELQQHPRLSRHVDSTLTVPQPFTGPGPIRLIALGQDPTIKNAKRRKHIATVLNLDRGGSLRRYLEEICAGLGLDLRRHVYATNLLKNFFVDPPAQLLDASLFAELRDLWLPTLRAELDHYPGTPVLTLGEPLLQTIIRPDVPRRVREYWGYVPGWKSGETCAFRYSKPDENMLNCLLFPFPHQPSISKQFYRERLDGYIAFMRRDIPMVGA